MSILKNSALILTIFIAGCSSHKNSPHVDELRIAVASLPDSIDPLNIATNEQARISELVYETLFSIRFNEKGGYLEPNLADGLATWSKDHRSFKVKLKKSVLFHDHECFANTKGHGRELTSEDVVFTIQRSLRQKKLSHLISRAKALDRYTVQIELKYPSFDVPYWLATPYWGMLPQECNPNAKVGTGPYRFATRNTSSESMDFDLNTMWRNHTETISRPKYLRLILSKDSRKTLEDFKDQKIHLMEIGGETLSEISQLVASGIRVREFENPDLYFLAFNLKDPLIGQSKQLRSLIARSIDVGPIIQGLYKGKAQAAYGLVSSNFLPGLSLKTTYVPSSTKLRSEFFHVTYIYRDNRLNRIIADFVARSLQRKGIELELKPMNSAEFENAIKQGKWQIAAMMSEMDFPRATNAFQQVLIGQFLSQTFDSGFRKLEREESIDPKDLALLIDVIREEIPVTPLFHTTSLWISQPWLALSPVLDNWHFRFTDYILHK